ncbi:MAG: type II toxin-antitoxin system RelE/ParE family toxin [Cyclobacteriaceae bacterium]
MKVVKWTRTARITLKETSSFILTVWNSDVNEAFITQLDYRIRQLQNNPALGSVFKNSQIRRLTIHKTVSLFYTNTSQHIKLLVIWDNRQNPDRLLKKLTKASDL